MRSFTCSCCRRVLSANPRIKEQHYCSQARCQRARKSKWQRRKMITDPDYQANQRDAQKLWRERNRDYPRNYRRRRHDCRKEPINPPGKTAKMDTFLPNISIIPGNYILVPIFVGFAKMDALPVKIIPLSTS
jgi:hypothetical protein